MQQNEATQTLGEINRIRKNTRSQLNSMWFPLALFGILTMLSGVVAEVSGSPGEELGIYWMFAGILGGAAVAVFYQKRQLQVGLQTPALPYALTGLAILIGTSAAGWFGSMNGYPMLAAAGPPLVVAAGYLVFAALDKSPTLAALALALGSAVGGLWIAGVDLYAYYTELTVAYGAILFVSGLAFRAAETARK